MSYDILPLPYLTCNTQFPKLVRPHYSAHMVTTFKSYQTWLITVSDQLPTTVKCSQRETSTTIIDEHCLVPETRVQYL